MVITRNFTVYLSEEVPGGFEVVEISEPSAKLIDKVFPSLKNCSLFNAFREEKSLRLKSWCTTYKQLGMFLWFNTNDENTMYYSAKSKACEVEKEKVPRPGTFLMIPSDLSEEDFLAKSHVIVQRVIVEQKESGKIFILCHTKGYAANITDVMGQCSKLDDTFHFDLVKHGFVYKDYMYFFLLDMVIKFPVEFYRAKTTPVTMASISMYDFFRCSRFCKWQFHHLIIRDFFFASTDYKHQMTYFTLVVAITLLSGVVVFAIGSCVLLLFINERITRKAIKNSKKKLIVSRFASSE